MEEDFKLIDPISPAGEGDFGFQSGTTLNVVVLSRNFVPTRDQLEVLNKGLSFIPTFKIEKGQKKQLLLDIQNYHRRLSLAAYFQGSDEDNRTPFTIRSDWTPPSHKLPVEILQLIEQDMKDFQKNFKVLEENPNLKKVELDAIDQLKKARHIVIKPADKGSGVVILDKEQYIFEVMRQLEDKVYYKKLSEPIYLETIPMVHAIVSRLKRKKFINHKQEKFLKGSGEPRERRFYILPKIHKPPEKWSVPHQIPPGRPIVSDCGSETYATAEYIDFFLNPLSILHPSYIKDTYHFIDIVKGLKIPTNSFFFSLDVDSLYTNIDIQAGLGVIKKTFAKYPRDDRPDVEILELLEINLTRNDFVFNGNFYLQIKGTAMGKRFAPSYANLFMANWEEEVLAKCKLKPLHYFRYLDDIWGVWPHTLEEFKQFMNTLNAHDPSIQLKSEINQNSIDFLDTTVYKSPEFYVNGKLDIKVFFKKTDTHALLYKSSFHPKHTFRGIVKSQLLRFFRICTKEGDFWEAVRILFGVLKKRGYSRSFLRQCLGSFQDQKLVYPNKRIPLITQFSSISKVLNSKLKRNFKEFLGDLGIFNNYEVVSAYKKNKNLKDLLVRAKLESSQESYKEMEQFCPYKYVKNTITKKIFKITQIITPQTVNVVYLCFCSKCNIKYVGETRNSMRKRMWQHKYNIINKKEINTPLVNHFILHGFQSLKIMGLQSNIIWTTKERKAVERRWMYLLGTIEPDGLNIKYNTT